MTRTLFFHLPFAPIAVNLTWDAIHRGVDMPFDESAKLGADHFGLVATTEDFRSGTDAFLHKRKAKLMANKFHERWYIHIQSS